MNKPTIHGLKGGSLKGRGLVGRSQRGASAIEVALMMSLIVVPLVTGVQMVQNRGGSRLDQNGDRIGTPTESYGGVTATTVVAPGPSTTAPPTTVLSTVSSAVMTGNAVAQNSQRWTATVVIELRDSGGQPLAGLNITGVWQAQSHASQATTCTTDGNGRCTVTQWGLRRDGSSAAPSTTFTLSTVTGTDLTIGPGVTGTSITVNRV